MFLSRGGLELSEIWEQQFARIREAEEAEDLKVWKVHRDVALRKMYPHVSMWRYYPRTETKQPMVDAYHSLTDKQRHQLHLDVRQAMLDTHGRETVDIYRNLKPDDKDRKDWGASSFSTNSEHLHPRTGGLKATVHWKDVMAHHGQERMPLGRGIHKSENEVILRPGANVSVERVYPQRGPQ